VKDHAASRQARQRAGGRGGKVGRLDPTQNSAGGRPGLGEGAGGAATPLLSPGPTRTWPQRSHSWTRCEHPPLMGWVRCTNGCIRPRPPFCPPPPPRQPQRRGIEGHPRSSGRRNDFLTRRLLNLRPLGLAKCSVETPDISVASPRG
jgi:hypothetical protein